MGPSGTLKGERTEILKGVPERAILSTETGGGCMFGEVKTNAFGIDHLHASVLPPKVNDTKFCHFQNASRQTDFWLFFTRNSNVM